MRIFIAVLFLLAGWVLISGVTVQAGAEDGLNDVQKQEIKNLIEQELLARPEIIVKAMDAYQEREQKKQEEQARAVIKENMDLLTAADLPSAGAGDGDVTVVEFFDYNCGYCKRALPDIMAMLKDDPKLRVVFKEMPILGPTSVTASQWALAAHRQGKYFDFHQAVMEFNGPKEEANLEKIAKDLGLDVAKMKEDVKGEDVKSMLDKARMLAEKIGVHGTPAFIVGGEFYPGYLGKEGLRSAITKARGGGKEP